MSDWGEIYRSIGAQPVINAIGSVTMLGGSTSVPEVKDAMDKADSSYVPMMELEEKAGEQIARLTNVPAAYVTSGAGSALTLATAAFMAGDNDDFIEQLPNTDGMKNEILIQRKQHYWYDRCLELAGATLVTFGSESETTKQDFENAITDKTCAVHYYADEQRIDPMALSLEDTIDVAKKHNLYVLVDAAGQIYPTENIGKYVRMGADIQCVAAKYLGAPHSVGFALGTQEAIDKLALQSFVGYEGRRIRGLGRPQKVDRSEIVGCVVALERWMGLNHEERLTQAETMTQTIINKIKHISTIDVAMIDNILGVQPFGLTITPNSTADFTVDDIIERLKAGDPPIWTRKAFFAKEGEDYMEIHMFGLKPGEEKIVGDRIVEVL
ncbi:MAG: hypothetical protein CL904_01455 [Dehalococcoidia bacterium]|nr:hypothetical protein [Dehalococcoidia bacterium]MQG16507.1 aminotransferase class V-fold PLP-dependent enzyme [SAR202 cluster bacterium]|tara:strand:+ start:12639 stop:13784 length:1146 start_codon:yes stop_codon:yes gene_type:complete